MLCWLVSPQEAASLYEKAGMLEKAAGIYIAGKNFAAAAPLMAQVSSPQLQRQYARAKEAEGRWAARWLLQCPRVLHTSCTASCDGAALLGACPGAVPGHIPGAATHSIPATVNGSTGAGSITCEALVRPSAELSWHHARRRWAEAATAYEAAGDSDQVVRLCLDKLGDQQRAAALVRKSASPDAAALVARHCLQSSDYRVGAGAGHGHQQQSSTPHQHLLGSSAECLLFTSCVDARPQACHAMHLKVDVGLGHG